ncbi:uncharacterized protein (DUF736 family) [Novosphingobium hassiacum]|uniref:Uncharacterized protein (DUF736 family) n=1 Tax=Novosphingobium hassiacum TaxID=173676 RepID=A0A7W6EY28_9SPHN|nr:DUF736 domain-containing protein [Novosphingobium hassiacum]MBB3862745.1 uncharacterized protein (DUF736 family) [Novosphingobium hassiacum]
MQIGCFDKDGDGFVGCLTTLTLDVPLGLVPTGFTGHGRAPDWRVHLAADATSAGFGLEVGSGWNHDSKAGSFIAVQLDCPSFPRPVRANLLRSHRDGEAHVLLWSPRLRRHKAQ